LKENMSDKVSGEAFVQRLKQQAEADGLSLLANVQVEGVAVSDRVTSMIEKWATISFGDFISLPVSDLSGVSQEEIDVTVLALAEVLRAIGCPDDFVIKRCFVDIVSVTNRPSSLPNRHLASVERKLSMTRLLQNQVLEFNYQFSVDVMCPPSGCDSDLATAAASLEERTTNDLTQAAQDGSLGTKLGIVSGGGSFISGELLIGPPSGAGSPGPCQTFLNDPSQDTRYYPDVAGKSGMCKNDGSPPAYMQLFYDTLEECCRNNYDDTYHICAGNTVDWYPAWNEAGEKCLNDADRLADYMAGNEEEEFLSETLEECCNRWYKWNPEGCISESGGVSAIEASNKWYVVWGGNQGNHCVQDCLADTGQTQYGETGLNCGGLAPPSKSLYETLELCCSEQLPWISSHTCEKESMPPPTEVLGTSRWYVSYRENKCVQDCSVRVAPTCGGIIKESHESLFETPRLCCEDKLSWRDSDQCESESLHEDDIVI